MKGETLILSIALGVICVGIIVLVWDLMRRRRARVRNEQALESALFKAAQNAHAAPGYELKTVLAEAEDGFIFRRHLALTGTATPAEIAPPALLSDTPEPPAAPRPAMPAAAAAPEPATGPELAPEPVAEAPAPPVLTCAGYGVSFGEKVILADISLTVPAHGITVLMGPAGTGKSTLLRSLAGLYAQNSLYRHWGEARFRGAAVDGANRPQLVTQRIQLTQRTALESLTFHLRAEMDNLPPAAQRDWACQWLTQAGAPELITALNTPFLDLPPLAQRIITILREATATTDLLMIDEPTSGLSPEDAEILLSRLQTLASHTALLVVLHNQKQARRIAQDVILLAGGRVQEQCATTLFFETPRTPVVAQFVATGSCAVPAPDLPDHMRAADVPAPPPLPAAAIAAISAHAAPPRAADTGTPPALPLSTADLDEIRNEIRAALTPAAAPPLRTITAAPEPAPSPSPTQAQNERAAVTRYPGNSAGPRGFVWIEEGRLAATPQPGVSADVDYDLSLLKGVGVTTLITLTERDFPQESLARHGLTNLHLPVADRKAPTAAEMDVLVSRMRELLERGEVLAVHCLAGLGRTGTILAAYLVKEKGLSAQVALNQVRRFNRQFVQSDDQEDFLTEYEVRQEQALLRDRAIDAQKTF